MSARTYLYVPGHRLDMFDRALERGADALVLDREDAVAAAAKDTARSEVADWVRARARRSFSCEVWVRVNADTGVAENLEVVIGPELTGILCLKTTVSALEDIVTALEGAEGNAGLASGSVRLATLLESATAFRELDAIVAHPRVGQPGLGEADLTSVLGVEPSPGTPELLPLRLNTVVASATAGKAPPVDPSGWALGIKTDSVRRPSSYGDWAPVSRRPSTRTRSRSSTSSRPARRRRSSEALVEQFEAAVKALVGYATDDDGRMTDEAVMRAALRTPGIRT